MSAGIQQLLTDLEEVSAQAVQALGSADQLLPLVERRGELIAQLPAVLSGAGPLAYEAWNRLVVIHQQGRWIEDNLNTLRARLALELRGNARGLAFLERVNELISVDAR